MPPPPPPPPQTADYGAPAAYQAPGYPAAAGAMPTSPQNGMGIASLVLGILGLVCCGSLLMSVAALILGVMGRKKAQQGLATNGGMATAGMILGIVGVALSILALITWAIGGFNSEFSTY